MDEKNMCDARKKIEDGNIREQGNLPEDRIEFLKKHPEYYYDGPVIIEAIDIERDAKLYQNSGEKEACKIYTKKM